VIVVPFVAPRLLRGRRAFAALRRAVSRVGHRCPLVAIGGDRRRSRAAREPRRADPGEPRPGRKRQSAGGGKPCERHRRRILRNADRPQLRDWFTPIRDVSPRRTQFRYRPSRVFSSLAPTTVDLRMWSFMPTTGDRHKRAVPEHRPGRRYRIAHSRCRSGDPAYIVADERSRDVRPDRRRARVACPSPLVEQALTLLCHFRRGHAGGNSCCAKRTCERRDGDRSKNGAERGDRGVGDRDPRRAPADESLGAPFFRAVERFAGAAGVSACSSESDRVVLIVRGRAARARRVCCVRSCATIPSVAARHRRGPSSTVSSIVRSSHCSG
jgi:hypothetical protein